MLATAAPSTVEYGLLGVTLMIIWRLLELGRTYMMKNSGAIPEDRVLHQQQVREIHAYTEAVQQMIAAGKFECQWRDRDEVRDMIETMRKLVSSIDINTQEVRNLAQEIRLTRNGKT